jgi:hypothetical protein
MDAAMLDLAYRLLRWEPANRLAPAEALHHPALAGIDGPLDAEHGRWLSEAEAVQPQHATGGGGGLVPRHAAGGGCGATSLGRNCADQMGAAADHTGLAAVSAADGTHARVVHASQDAATTVVIAPDAGQRGSTGAGAPR